MKNHGSCPCGNRAVMRDSGAPACAKCLRIEAVQERDNKRLGSVMAKERQNADRAERERKQRDEFLKEIEE